MIVNKIGQYLSGIWKSANAKPPSFEHLTEAEHAMAEGFIQDFDRKVANGYFDEDVEADYRRFLFRWRCTKEEVDSACMYMKQETAKASPSLKASHRRTQDRYWQVTGGVDTRQSHISNE